MKKNKELKIKIEEVENDKINNQELIQKLIC